MSAAVVPAVVPPGTRVVGPLKHRSAGRRALPLAQPAAPRVGSTVYGLAALDDRGRCTDRVALGALAWVAGMAVTMTLADGLIVVVADPAGGRVVTPQGFLRLPAAMRWALGLRPGDRVLLVADPQVSRLVIYPPAVLDVLVAGLVGGGEHR